MIQSTTQAPADSATSAPVSSATPDGRATTFQAVEGGPEQHSGTTLMVEAYVVLWVILMAWLVLMWRRQTDVNSRLDELEHAIDRAAAKLEKK